MNFHRTSGYISKNISLCDVNCTFFCLILLLLYFQSISISQSLIFRYSNTKNSFSIFLLLYSYAILSLNFLVFFLFDHYPTTSKQPLNIMLCKSKHCFYVSTTRKNWILLTTACMCISMRYSILTVYSRRQSLILS